ncbi:MAG TPA: RsmE family RNA methyltransferase [Planctomycetota bacterium]|nr:RsmE family RNA methyltransferase [Planctomycetota bacterium]
MRRFLVPPPLAAGETALPPDEARHLVSVLRGAVGDAVEVTDGRGAEAEAVVASVSRAAAAVRVHRVRAVPEPRPLELWCALPRAGAADDVVRVATEVGATAIRPLLCARGVWRPDGDDAKRRARFEKAAANALKQCRGAWMPAFPPPVAVEDLRFEDGDFAWFGAPRPDAPPPTAHADALRAAGARPARVGRHVLRVETAAIALLALAGACRD